MAKLSTHVLDTAKGSPGEGIRVVLYRLHGEGGRKEVAEAITNADGRADAPLLVGEALLPDWYELDFHLGAYFALSTEEFLDVVTVRFKVAAGENYHVPLLASPYGYTTYRGS